MIEDLHWFGIRWNLGPGSDPSSSHETLFKIDKYEKKENDSKMICLTTNKKIKIDSLLRFEKSELIDENIDDKMNKKIFETYTKTSPLRRNFFGIDLHPYINIFHQSKRMNLYAKGLKKLFDLRLGIRFFFLVFLFYFVHTQFYKILFTVLIIFFYFLLIASFMCRKPTQIFYVSFLLM